MALDVFSTIRFNPRFIFVYKSLSNEHTPAYKYHNNDRYNPTVTILQITFIKSMGLGGGMVWALDLDDYTGTQCGAGTWPLMTTIKKGVLESEYLNF